MRRCKCLLSRGVAFWAAAWLLIAPVDWQPSQSDVDHPKIQQLATKLLAQNSKYYESWDQVYRSPIQLTAKYQPTGYLFRFPLYLQGSRDAYILLTTSSGVLTDKDDSYEILIGSDAHHIKKNGKVLATNSETGILSPKKPSRIGIEVTNGGAIKVFTVNNPYAPLLYAMDSNPIKVKYVNFASLSRMQFFYDIDEPAIVAKKDKLEVTAIKAISALHRLIVPIAVPFGAQDIYFKTHFKVYEPVATNKYEKWLKLSAVDHVQSSEFLVQFLFFVQGSSNAHIIFSPTENPSSTENVYEVVIGAFDNTRIMIRKRGILLADAIIPNVLNVLNKTQFVFEVSTEGEIRLFSADKRQPLLEAYDPKPVDVAYFSFKNENNEKLSFFYGYNPEQLPNVIIPVVEPATKKPLFPGFGLQPILPQVDIFNIRKNIRENILPNVFAPTKVAEIVEPIHIIKTVGTTDQRAVKYEPAVIHPMFEEMLPVDVNRSTLVKNSQYVESWNNDNHKSLVRVSGRMQPAGYILRFPFYVQGSRDAYIRLWPTDNLNDHQDYYEIQLGVVGNSVARILRSGKVLAEISEENLLNEWQLKKMVIEVTIDGRINLYTAYNRWAPLLSVIDPTPIHVKYISFGSHTRVQFFYDVIEKLCSQSVAQDDQHELEHPLLAAVKVPIGHENEWFNKYFKVVDTSKLTRSAEEQLIALNDLKNVKPEHYKLRLPLFINGSQNARILLASKSSISSTEDAYVIDIGTWMNSGIEIRKRLNGPIIAKAIVPDVLSTVKPKLFVIEVTDDGWIRVFSEDDHMKPLISAFDPYPVDTEFVGFSSYHDEAIQFYYDYSSRSGSEYLLEMVVPFKYDTADLSKRCKSYVSESVDFAKFMKISEFDAVQVGPFGKTFSFYVDGSKDLSIVLADSFAPKREIDFVYEILIGSIFERKPVVVRHRLADPLWYNAFLNTKLVKTYVEIANGKIRIFRDNETKPWIERNYDANVNLDYISFGAPNGSSSIYYKCSV